MLTAFFSMVGASVAATTRFTDGVDTFFVELDPRAASVTTTRARTRIVVEFARRSSLPIAQTFVGLRLKFTQRRTPQRSAGSRLVVIQGPAGGRVTADLYDGDGGRVAPVTVRFDDRRVVVTVPTARLRPATLRGKTWFRADLGSYPGIIAVTPPGENPAPAPPPGHDSIPDRPAQISLG